VFGFKKFLLATGLAEVVGWLGRLSAAELVGTVRGKRCGDFVRGNAFANAPLALGLERDGLCRVDAEFLPQLGDRLPRAFDPAAVFVRAVTPLLPLRPRREEFRVVRHVELGGVLDTLPPNACTDKVDVMQRFKPAACDSSSTRVTCNAPDRTNHLLAAAVQVRGVPEIRIMYFGREIGWRCSPEKVPVIRH